MRVKKFKTFVGDFETTVYDGQKDTLVWASGLCELFTEDAKIFGDIDSTFDYLFGLRTNVIVYYHNLKFDGSFILTYLLNLTGFTQAIERISEKVFKWMREFEMPKRSFKYSISDKGRYYNIIIKTGTGHIIEIRDSYKLLPFSVEEIGKSFETKHKKLNIEYTGFRYPNCYISDSEKEYLKNDLFVPKEALEIMIKQGHEKITIGSCCLEEFKVIMGDDFNKFFPDLTNIECPFDGFNNADEFIRKSYRGGWCYLVPEKANIIMHNGLTADVNSLYPSQMHSDSGNNYPIGFPNWFNGSVPDDVITNSERYFFIHVKTRFYIKDGYLPTIQIKGNPLYPNNEWLTSSDVVFDDMPHSRVKLFGKDLDTRQDLYLTPTDYKLLHEHYNLVDYEEIGGCWFYTFDCLFDIYINKYAEIKMKNKGAIRTLAKLFLNNLYGKMSSGTDSSFKIVYLKEDGSIGYYTVEEHEKKTVYIAVGSAITANARYFTITRAQLNYHGSDKAGFCYADTDSIHCDNTSVDDLIGIDIDAVKFNHWKIESEWDEAIFVRQKTYIEHIIKKDGEIVDKPFYDIKCAGMGKRCKELLSANLSNEDIKTKTEAEDKFMRKQLVLSDFKRGLRVPSNLKPKMIRGGTLLVQQDYNMR